MAAGWAVYLAVGQAIFEDRLVANLSQIVPPDTVREVLSGGATQLYSIARGQGLSIVINAYSAAITKVFFLPAIAPAISFAFVCGTRWISVKKDRQDASKEVKE